MAHQTHALPWNTLASHFNHVKSHHQHVDVRPQNKPTQAKALEHFCKVFAKQIHDFGETERAKYQPAENYRKRASTWVKSDNNQTENEERASETRSQRSQNLSSEGPETRKVLPTKLQQHGPHALVSYFVRSGQDVEGWILSNSHEQYIDWLEGADIFEILVMEAASASPALSAELEDDEGEKLKRDSIETLLLMANHPRMKILGLKNMHHGHVFGVSRVAEEAVIAYIYVNLIIAMRERGSDVCDLIDDSGGRRRKCMDCKTYRKMLEEVAGHYDGDTQTLVHRTFFLGNPGQSFAAWRDVPKRDILEDTEGVKEYLKGVWRVMVTYDVIIREAGGDPTWEKECENFFSYILGVRKEADD